MIFEELHDGLWKKPELTNLTDRHVIKVNRNIDTLTGGSLISSSWRGDTARLPPAGKRMLGGSKDVDRINELLALGLALGTWDNWQVRLGRERPTIRPWMQKLLDTTMPGEATSRRMHWLIEGGIARKSFDASICVWDRQANTATAIGHYVDTGLARHEPQWVPVLSKIRMWEEFAKQVSDWDKVTAFAYRCSGELQLRRRIWANLSWRNRSPLIWDHMKQEIVTLPEVEYYRILGGFMPTRERSMKIMSALPKGQCLLSLLPDGLLGRVIRDYPEAVL